MEGDMDNICLHGDAISVDLTESEAQNICNSKLTEDVKNNMNYDNVVVKGCVIGASGAGKSALVNSLCALSGEGRAEEGALETTTVPTSYKPPNGAYEIWDIPGVGTVKVPPETYAERFKLSSYDFIIVMLVSPRLQKANKLNEWAIKLAKVNLKKPVFLVYSMFDLFVLNYYQQKTQRDTKAQMLVDLPIEKRKEYVIAAKALLQKIFPPETLYIGRRLVPRFQADFDHVFDYTTLLFRISQSLPARKQAVVLQNFSNYSDVFLQMKKASLKPMMIAMSVGSSVAGAVPIPGPGIATDITIIVSFARKCKQVFGLEDEALKRAFSPEVVALFIPRIAVVVGSIGASITFSSLDDAIKVVPIFGSIAGSVVGAVVSGPIMFVTLCEIRDTMADIAKQIMVKEAEIQAKKHYDIIE